MQYSLTIPSPCNEPWEQMIPDGNGRHCAQCSKTVVDFTEWEQDAILQYLQAQGAGRTCGRFRESQLGKHDTQSFIDTVSAAPAPFYSKWLAIFLLAFGLIQMSCNTDEPVKQQQVLVESTLGAPMAVADTIQTADTHMVGFTEPVIIEEKDTVKMKSKIQALPHVKVIKAVAPPERLLQGDVMPEYPPMDTGAAKRD